MENTMIWGGSFSIKKEKPTVTPYCADENLGTGASQTNLPNLSLLLVARRNIKGQLAISVIAYSLEKQKIFLLHVHLFTLGSHNVRFALISTKW